MIEHKKYLQEIVNRIDYFYKQLDGTNKYPGGQVTQICKMIKELNDAQQKGDEQK